MQIKACARTLLRGETISLESKIRDAALDTMDFAKLSSKEGQYSKQHFLLSLLSFISFSFSFF